MYACTNKKYLNDANQVLIGVISGVRYIYIYIRYIYVRYIYLTYIYVYICESYRIICIYL